jgi:septal ring factor EnvC (AmiA/AmiB activator)
MPYCKKCGAQMGESDLFCEACGAKQEHKPTKQVTPTPLPPRKAEPMTPAVEKPVIMPPAAQQTRPSKTKWGIIAIVGLLVVGLIAIGTLYGVGVSNLSKANANIVDLEGNVATLNTQLASEKANVASLQTQLASEKANVSNLQTQLTDEKTKSSNLQTQLTTATNDLNSSKAQVTQLQSDLDASKLQVANLQADLASSNANVIKLQADLDKANASVTKLQGDLDKANADLTSAKAMNTSLTAELTKVKDPRHFNSLQELQSWLQNDDTNIKYAAQPALTRAYILQVEALRDGYLLPVSAYWTSSTIYFNVYNIALIGDTIYQVSSYNDAIYAYIISIVPPLPPLHPLPIQ